MKPSPGRIVMYTPVYAPQMGEQDQSKSVPATIIRVDNEEFGVITIGAFSTSYTYVAGVPHVEPAEDGYPVAGAWFWPPRV